MRYVWADATDDPSWGNVEKAGANGIFVPMFDPLYDRQFLQTEVRGRGYAAGIYLGAGWLPIDTAARRAELVQKVHEQFQSRFVPGLKVMFNLEEHQPGHIIDVLERWRELHPTVGTSWSMEPNQGGWMGPDVTKGGKAPSSFVQRVIKTKVRLVPQLFFGGMAPAGEEAVMWDVAKRGFPASIISPFYDAARLPADWDGYAFTAGRLLS